MRVSFLSSLALVLAVALFGCTGTDVCGATKQPVLAPDGGAFRCVVPEDCPRPSNVSICLTNTNPDKECVTCTDTRCVETIPTTCD
jgi:hypothetical protein